MNNLEDGNECCTPLEDSRTTFRNRYLIEKMERETGFEPATSSGKLAFLGIECKNLWCGRGDLKPHALTGAATSRLCVCQFRHFRSNQFGRTSCFGTSS
jgi:hypothetical protein